ncbi:response regulator transcription factor [Erwinia sp. P7711]|uniref:response regulator transcription factor n=1 Tax=Erwinia sp. P7711 TaxID=3141451 RepID=UPI00319729CE
MLQRKRMLRIGVSDESPFIIYSIQSILAAEITRQEIYSYPVEAEHLLIRLKEQTPDILITDFSFSFERNDLNGVKKLEEIHKQLPELNIIVFTTQSSKAILNRILQIPVKAIVSKRDDQRELIEAVQWVCSASPGIYYSRQMKKLAQESLACSANTLLSSSEMEVIRLFAMGYSLMDIAKLRERSVSTVATQKYNAMHKLQLHSNTDLIKYVFSQELV